MTIIGVSSAAKPPGILAPGQWQSGKKQSLASQAKKKNHLSDGNIKTTSSYSEQLVGDNLDARNSVRHQVRHRNANIRHNGVLTTESILGEKATARFFVNFSDTYRQIVWNIKDQSCLLIFANYASRYNISAHFWKKLRSGSLFSLRPNLWSSQRPFVSFRLVDKSQGQETAAIGNPRLESSQVNPSWAHCYVCHTRPKVLLMLSGLLY